MQITGQMIHETYCRVSGDGKPWQDINDAAKDRYNRMATMINGERPTIVCLCGSTRFGEAFREANLQETLAGKIVLSIGCEWHSDQALHLTSDDKERLDKLHLRKIDLADEVFILNVGGYVGESTQREIEYAWRAGKLISWLVDPAPVEAIDEEAILTGLAQEIQQSYPEMNDDEARTFAEHAYRHW